MEYLFSYGTLQQKNVQLKNFGRILEGSKDVLQKYVVKELEITDETVLKISNKRFHPILFFNSEDLRNLNQLGHLIGLHSHNHPTLLEKLNYDEQKNEYEQCLSSISNILINPKNEIKYMSHPCGSYNNDTLEILKEHGFVVQGIIDTLKLINLNLEIGEPYILELKNIAHLKRNGF